MRGILLVGALLVAGCGSTPPADYEDRYYTLPPEDLATFQEPLSPYGRWVDTPEYGTVWQPGVAAGWRPYTEGRWAYTDEYGWLWNTNEPWGWATYHYGRWAFLPGYGWVWAPGNVWAPAWVQWRYGHGMVGWAPLPARARSSRAPRQSAAARAAPPPEWYSFVDEQHLASDTPLTPHIQPVARNRELLAAAPTASDPRRADGRVIDAGIDVKQLEQATGRPVRRHRITPATAPVMSGAADDSVRIYQPPVLRRPAPPAPTPAPAPADARLRRRSPTSAQSPVPQPPQPHRRRDRSDDNAAR